LPRLRSRSQIAPSFSRFTVRRSGLRGPAGKKAKRRNRSESSSRSRTYAPYQRQTVVGPPRLSREGEFSLSLLPSLPSSPSRLSPGSPLPPLCRRFLRSEKRVYGAYLLTFLPVHRRARIHRPRLPARVLRLMAASPPRDEAL